MNSDLIAKIINSVGLFFDGIGAVFIAIEVVKQYKGKEYFVEPSRWDDVEKSTIEMPEYTAWKESKYKYMKIGLCFLLFGFALQIFSNFSIYLFKDNDKLNVTTEAKSIKLPTNQPSIQAASDVKEAIDAFKQAIRIDPDDAEAYYYLGVAYANLGMDKEAIDAFKQAIRIDPDDADAYYNLGIAYIHLGMLKEAIEAFKQLIRINPDFADAHYNLGGAYVLLGMHKEAIEAFKQVIRIKPDDADTHLALGDTYSNLDMYKEAIEAFKQVIRIKPDDAYAHLNLGRAYDSLNDRGSALEQYKILKSLDSEWANKLLKLINK